MKAKTELLLYQLMWTAELLMRPTYRNFSGSFEQWAYQNGFLRQIQRLEREKYLESRTTPGSLNRVYCLTQKGLQQAMGGYHPEHQWNRPWDGRWRLVFFDLPESKRTLRADLRAKLRSLHYGCLQKSVWISPDPVDSLRPLLKQESVHAEVLTFFEGTMCGGESAKDIVSSAWNFSAVDKAYRQHDTHLRTMPTSGTPQWPKRMKAWLEQERVAWSDCMHVDPLLPRPLLPTGYPGCNAWANRKRVLLRAGTLMRDYSP